MMLEIKINKQEEHKWPISQWDYEYWGLGIPKSFSTYLKVSENKKPIRIETMEVRDSYDEDLNMVFHSSRLLKSYSFPVGLDIVDKLAKTPDWMKRNVRKNAIMLTVIKEQLQLQEKLQYHQITLFNRQDNDEKNTVGSMKYKQKLYFYFNKYGC